MCPDVIQNNGTEATLLEIEEGEIAPSPVNIHTVIV
jgi:hypothetical protein